MHQVGSPAPPVAEKGGQSTKSRLRAREAAPGATVALLVTSAVFAGGAWAACRHVGSDLARRWGGVYGYLYGVNEPGVMLVLAAVTALVLFLTLRGAGPGERRPRGGRVRWVDRVDAAGWVGILAGSTLVVCAVGRHVVCHDYALSMDEYLSEFQARIFAHGRWRSPLPPTVWPWAAQMTPIFVHLDREHMSWVTSYWPAFSLLQAPFVAVGQPGFLNPLLAAGSIWGVADCARRIWPDIAGETLAGRNAAALAALLLATSPQFLVMAMTSYAMPAHLFCNLLWLSLYLRNTPRSLALAPLVGVLALGLHKPNIHALFALPLVLRIVRQRRWKTALWFGLVYLVGLAGWYQWMKVCLPQSAVELRSGSGVVKFFEAPKLHEWITRFETIPLLFAWQSWLVCPGVVAACGRWRQVPPVVRDLAWGGLALWVFYYFGRENQGHGWGYRYCHATIGSLVLVSVSGLRFLEQEWGASRFRSLVVVSSLGMVLAMVPLRCWQAERFVAPFARADRYLSRVDADYVFVPVTRVWYAGDLVRNDPFLNQRPRRLFPVFDRDQLGEFVSSHKVTAIKPEELVGAGLAPLEVPPPTRNR